MHNAAFKRLLPLDTIESNSILHVLVQHAGAHSHLLTAAKPTAIRESSMRNGYVICCARGYRARTRSHVVLYTVLSPRRDFIASCFVRRWSVGREAR